MRNLQALLVMFFGCVSAPVFATSQSPTAPETTINILILKEAGVSQSQIESQLNVLEDTWTLTNFGVPPTVSLNIINKSSPLILPDFPSSDTDLQHLSGIDVFVSTGVAGLPAMRDSLAADVVITFVDTYNGSITFCEAAPQDNWINESPSGGQFNEDPATGLDLDGRNDYYMVLVATVGFFCQGPNSWRTTTHGFGHLFGAGHYEVPSGSPAPRPGLFANSRADVGTSWIKEASIQLSPSDSPCTSAQCKYLKLWSGWTTPFTDPSRRNTDTMQYTMESVAHYRIGEPVFGNVDLCFDGEDNDGDGNTDMADAECGPTGTELPAPPPQPPTCDATNTPFNVYAYLVQVCVPPASESLYRLSWSHHCPEAVSYYDVYSRIPPGSPLLLYEWSTPVNSTDAYIEGGSAEVFIRSCGTGGCSSFSWPGVIVTDQC